MGSDQDWVRLKKLRISLIGLAAISLLTLESLVTPAFSTAPIALFDGNYEGHEILTITTTLPTNPPTKRTVTVTSPSFSFAVVQGKASGALTGVVVNSAGTGSLTVPINGYGSVKTTVNFARNPSTRVVNLSGSIAGRFSGSTVVIGGQISAHTVDKFKFTIPTNLPNAKIGTPYVGHPFCNPAVPPGYGCGWPFKATNPSGGKVPYIFKLKVGWLAGGGDLIPPGLVLNSMSGQIIGTPNKGLRTRIFHLIVCAYDARDSWNGVCRATVLSLRS